MARLAFALLLVVAFAGCDAHTAVNGRVLDADDHPVEGAKVSLSADPSHPRLTRSATTGSDGKYDVGIIHGPGTAHFDFVVSKDSYKTHSEELEPKRQYRDHTVKLVPEK